MNVHDTLVAAIGYLTAMQWLKLNNTQCEAIAALTTLYFNTAPMMTADDAAQALQAYHEELEAIASGSEHASMTALRKISSHTPMLPFKEALDPFTEVTPYQICEHCDKGYHNRWKLWADKALTEEQWQAWFCFFCGRCGHMSEVCMYGETDE